MNLTYILVIIAFVLGVIACSLIAFLAYKKELLSLSGLIAAIIVGTIIFIYGGVISFSLMMAFFISSSIFSKLFKDKKKNLEIIQEKGDNRDYMQVIANGGVAAVMLILFAITGDFNFFLASSVSFAVSNSDTWASELGVVSKKKPFSIATFKPVEIGISGGITLLGIIAAAAGAIFIGGAYCIMVTIVRGIDFYAIIVFFIISIFGFIGSLIDSFLGATIQGQYYDEVGKYYTEKKVGPNGKNKLVKGISFVNNDVVNILSNVIASLLIFVFL